MQHFIDGFVDDGAFWMLKLQAFIAERRMHMERAILVINRLWHSATRTGQCFIHARRPSVHELERKLIHKQPCAETTTRVVVIHREGLEGVDVASLKAMKTRRVWF